ncbi:MAG: hypothetical protein DRI26_02845 [Chloroflexi bacterium]|nr:MAG: hypothetical protein DRI26_02845 [Chloroflexota bacterium]
MGRPLYSLRAKYDVIQEAGLIAERAFGAVLPVERSWNAISVVAPILEGHINSPGIYDQTDGKTYREADFPVPIPFGHSIQGYANCWNDTPVAITVRLTGWFIAPDGTKKAESSYTTTIEPGQAKSGGTDFVTVDQAGTWVLHIRMEAI